MSTEGRGGGRRTATATPFVHGGPRRGTENTLTPFCPRRGTKGQGEHLFFPRRGAKGREEDLFCPRRAAEDHEGPRRKPFFVREGARRKPFCPRRATKGHEGPRRKPLRGHDLVCPRREREKTFLSTKGHEGPRRAAKGREGPRRATKKTSARSIFGLSEKVGGERGKEWGEKREKRAERQEERSEGRGEREGRDFRGMRPGLGYSGWRETVSPYWAGGSICKAGAFQAGRLCLWAGAWSACGGQDRNRRRLRTGPLPRLGRVLPRPRHVSASAAVVLPCAQ